MRIDIITIFPNMVEVPLSESLIGRGREKGLFEIHTHDLRDYTDDKHRVVDDIPYGGGPGMVMKPDPILKAVKTIDPENNALRLITSAGGTIFNQGMAADFVKREHIIIICGHYKGVDQRAIEIAHLQEVSIGDFVLTGGEYAAVVIADAILRLIPGTLKDFGSANEDSHFSGLLGPVEYTRPEVIEGQRVPEVLISGHHEKIRRWRLGNALTRTKTLRPDMLEKRGISNEEYEIMNEYVN
jgi:tRNA (guanine37-N1)-methyltransferase